MKIIIDIPEEEYNYILKSDNSVFADCASKECMMYVIKNGTPLPKGHGRLIDAEILDLENLYRENDDGSFSLVYTKSEFSTIIEADKDIKKE